jgi:hypothetical protein
MGRLLIQWDFPFTGISLRKTGWGVEGLFLLSFRAFGRMKKVL